MKRRLLLFVPLFLLLTMSAQSQTWKYFRQEYFFGAGATNFLGELGGANQVGTNFIRDFDFPSIRPGVTLGYRYYFTERSAISTEFGWSMLSGNDQHTDEPIRNYRNLHFRTNVFEISTRYEITFLQRKRPGHRYNLKGVRGWRFRNISGYLFAGIGTMYFNPKAKGPDGEWVALKPLRTEGQGLVPTRKEYSRVQVIIPYGIGFTYAIDQQWSIGIEYGIRKTFTDYIDDVSTTYFDKDALFENGGQIAVDMADPSAYHFDEVTFPREDYPEVTWTAPGQQRGDPRDKDAYMIALIKVYYKIPAGRGVIPKF